MPAFHLSVPVDDLGRAEHFYIDVLGCEVRRASRESTDVDFHGHQLSLRAVSGSPQDGRTCEVDGTVVPVRHFGLVLSPDAWRELADRLVARGAHFLMTPRSRFVGQLGEQHTMFVADPAGNAIEFKAFPGGVWT